MNGHSSEIITDLVKNIIRDKCPYALDAQYSQLMYYSFKITVAPGNTGLIILNNELSCNGIENNKSQLLPHCVKCPHRT